MKKIFAFMMVLIFTGCALNNNPSLQISDKKPDNKIKLIWQKTFGGKKDDEANSIIQTKDGNFMIAGATASPLNGDTQYVYIIKIVKTVMNFGTKLSKIVIIIT